MNLRCGLNRFFKLGKARISSSVAAKVQEEKCIHEVGRAYQKFRKLAIILPRWGLDSIETKCESKPKFFQLELGKKNPSHIPHAHRGKLSKSEINLSVEIQSHWNPFNKSLLSHYHVPCTRHGKGQSLQADGGHPLVSC